MTRKAGPSEGILFRDASFFNSAPSSIDSLQFISEINLIPSRAKPSRENLERTPGYLSGNQTAAPAVRNDFTYVQHGSENRAKPGSFRSVMLAADVVAAAAVSVAVRSLSASTDQILAIA